MASIKKQLQLYSNLVRYQSTQASKRFIIFGRGRSGSTTLVSLLNCLPEVWCDGEILSKPVLWPQLYLKANAITADSAFYGCKVLSYQLRDVHKIQSNSDFFRQLSQSGVYIIYLKRENLLHHAISNMRARNFGFHKRRAIAPIHKDKIFVDPAAVIHWMDKSQRLQEYESALLQGIPHLPLTYEKHLASESHHQSTVDLICRYFSIQSIKARSQYQKISPQTLEASVENYGELVNHLRSTRYYHHLETSPSPTATDSHTMRSVA